MVFSILLLIILIVIVVIIFMASKVDPEAEGGESAVIRKVFVYLVLFATLMMVIGGSISAFMAAVDLVAPAPYYQSFEEYASMYAEKPYADSGQKTPAYTTAELENRYNAMVQAEAERQKGRAYNTLVKSFGWIVIPLPIFIYFQRRINRNEGLV